MAGDAVEKLIIPPGKATGCLPRASQYGKLCDKLEDRIEVIPREYWQEYLNGGIELRSRVREILDQNGAGSCACESSGQSYMIVLVCQGHTFVLVNPWSVYSVTSGGYDGGSNIDTNLAYMRDVGILPMSVWPRSKGPLTKPPQRLLDTVAINYRIDEFFDIGSVDEVGTALIKGMPVVFGWQGHSCVLVDLIDKDRGRYANSWHSSWGDEGFGIIRFSQINWGYGAFAVRSVVDPSSQERKQ